MKCLLYTFWLIAYEGIYVAHRGRDRDRRDRRHSSILKVDRCEHPLYADVGYQKWHDAQLCSYIVLRMLLNIDIGT